VKIDSWITRLNLYPDGYNMIYDFEWPKTAADYARLFDLKSFNLQEIAISINYLEGKLCTTGIELMFHGETLPISYG
jgi:hypothetical protein